MPEKEFLRKDAAGGVDADGAGFLPVLQLGRHVGKERRAVDFVLVARLPEIACETSVGCLLHWRASVRISA